MDAGSLFINFMILIGSATAVATVFHYLKIPTIVGFIITGMLIGPYGLGFLSDVPGVTIISEVGLALLMFTIGLEFSLEKVRTVSKSLVGLGLGMILTIILVTVAVGQIFGFWSIEKSVAMGMVLSLSSSAIVLKILQSRRELETPHGNASVGILLAQDISFVPMVLLLPIMFGAAEHSVTDGGGWYLKVLTVGGALAGLFLFARYLLNPITEKILQTRSNELFFFMLLFLICAIAMGSYGLMGSITLGAFLAGLVFASSPVSKQALSDILPLRDMFLGLLFTSIGMLVDLRFFINELHLILLFVVVVFILKVGVVYGLARIQKYTRSVSLVAALMTFQVGEFSIVMMKEISKTSVFDQFEIQLLLSLTVVTMALTPLVFKLAPELARSYSNMRKSGEPSAWTGINKVSEADDTKTGHAIIVGFGVAGKALARVLSSLEVPYVVIEMNYSTVARYKSQSQPIIYGDASREEILVGASISTAKMLILTVPDVGGSTGIIAAARHARPDIEVVVRVEYERGIGGLKSFGGIELVVGEYEVTLELLHKALDVYGVSEEQIREYLDATRKSLDHGLIYSLGSARNRIGLPGWQASALIRPYKIPEKAFASGKSLVELHLRAHTGVSVATVFREGTGTTVPHGDFTVEVGDILHLVGDKNALASADQFIRHGKVNSES